MSGSVASRRKRALVAVAAFASVWLAHPAANLVAETDPGAEASVAAYLQAMETAGLLDAATGNKKALTAEVAVAEKLLREQAYIEAAVALYAIVESPRFADFDDFVEYHNAEYYLAVSLASSGAYDSALLYLERVLKRGPGKLYFGPAHRRAVDIAIETRDYAGVLARLEGLKLSQALPVGAIGERLYLKARIAYGSGKYDEAEGFLSRISRKSRLYSSSLYMRGVIRTRRGQYFKAAEALCEIVDTPDDGKFTFVVDDRYFTIKDLARLGLGRIAHERGEYNDAYYHYFQIPDDSDRLPEALFEATWSMYQKRELGTARDLSKEFLAAFPSAPITPEARLLAGYIELADCKFDAAQKSYDTLIKDLQPVVDELDRIRKSSDLRARLFDKALARWRAERADPEKRIDFKAKNPRQQVLGLLRLDPKFVRLHDAVRGLRRAAGDAPHVHRSWRTLGRQLSSRKVGETQGEATSEQQDATDASSLLEDVRRLNDELSKARQQLRRGRRDKTLPADVAEGEDKRLVALSSEIDALEQRAGRAAKEADDALTANAPAGLAPMVRTDIERSRTLERAATDLGTRLQNAADDLAQKRLEALYQELRRVLDKAKLGKIDAVIGQKRRLEIEVQDLSSGRFPAELHGQLWEKGLIGDDEVYWPFEGEFWSDEYEGWR